MLTAPHSPPEIIRPRKPDSISQGAGGLSEKPDNPGSLFTRLDDLSKREESLSKRRKKSLRPDSSPGEMENRIARPEAQMARLRQARHTPGALKAAALSINHCKRTREGVLAQRLELLLPESRQWKKNGRSSGRRRESWQPIHITPRVLMLRRSDRGSLTSPGMAFRGQREKAGK